MKRWAFLVAVLYILALIALTIPAIWLAFVPQSWLTADHISDVATFIPYWGWLGIMFICQLCLLIVPVKIAANRPVSRRTLLWPILTGGFLAGTLMLGAGYSVYEFIFKGQNPVIDWPHWVPVIAGGFLWIVWSIVFYRQTRSQNADSVVRKQTRWLLRGSILELLIAVPTHIVARYRNYCCAGFMTFIGITFGIAIMLFAYGPAVFFLFVARWKRLHPQPPPTTPPASGKLPS